MLRPGAFLFNVWDRTEANAFADLFTTAAAEVSPEDPPRFLACTPHGYHDAAQIRADLKLAGFPDVALTTVEETSRAPSPREPAVAYCQGTPLRNEIEARDAARLAEANDRATAAIARRHGSGAVAAPIRAHVVLATG